MTEPQKNPPVSLLFRAGRNDWKIEDLGWAGGVVTVNVPVYVFKFAKEKDLTLDLTFQRKGEPNGKKTS